MSPAQPPRFPVNYRQIAYADEMLALLKEVAAACVFVSDDNEVSRTCTPYISDDLAERIEGVIAQVRGAA